MAFAIIPSGLHSRSHDGLRYTPTAGASFGTGSWVF